MGWAVVLSLPSQFIMFYDQFGRPRKLSDLNAVVEIEKLKQKSGSNPWPVIEKIIDVWQKTRPREWKAFLYEIDDVRKTRRGKFASSDPRKDEHGGILRYTLDIPQKVMYMIRAVYTNDELPMDKKFFREFAVRFPKMRVAEKI